MRPWAFALTGAISIAFGRLLHLRILGDLIAEDAPAPSDVMTTLQRSSGREVILPSVSFSLAAIVRRGRGSQERGQPERMLLVHEKPPRGWWLSGGGVEQHDATPLDGAVREAVEEAGVPSLLPLLSSKSMEGLLPIMTHLISLEQSPGRIRFIFRGEWIDDGAVSVLKRPPGDKESIEAKWMNWDEMQLLAEKKGGGSSTSSLNDPWLRGHEPLTFYGMLERCQKDGPVPGLPVKRMHGDEAEVIGAFFGREPSNGGTGLTMHGRAAILTHLRCRLLVCDRAEQTIAVEASTKQFPSSIVENQNTATLKDLVDEMIVSFGDTRQHQVRLLRADHFIHSNGREATLTVFPVLFLDSSGKPSFGGSTSWVLVEDLRDSFERKLAQAALSLGTGEDETCNLDILRDTEGPK